MERGVRQYRKKLVENSQGKKKFVKKKNRIMTLNRILKERRRLTMEADGRLLTKWRSVCRFHKVENFMTFLCTRKSLHKIILVFAQSQPNLFLIIADFHIFTSFLMTYGSVLSSENYVS